MAVPSPKLTMLRWTSALVAAIVFLAAGDPAKAANAVFVGAGDIASCSGSGDEATAALLDQIPGKIFTLGDNVYDTGTTSQFANCYQPSWGRHKSRTRPIPGNHEYKTLNASGYFDYFGTAAGPPQPGILLI